jgi:hypothetical protein
MAVHGEVCRRCGREIPAGGAVYGDHNRKFCSEACATAQLDLEQGVGHARAKGADLDAAGDRVPPGGGPAQSKKRSPRER